MAAQHTRATRSVAVIPLVVLFALGGCAAPIDPKQISPLRSVSVRVFLDRSGTTTMSTRYGLASSGPTTVGVVAPAEATTTAVTVDGDQVPRPGSETTLVLDGPASTVTATFTGTVERTPASATFHLVLFSPAAPAGRADRLVPIEVAFQLPAGASPDGTRGIDVFGIEHPDLDPTGDTLHLTGSVHPGRAATLTADLDPVAFTGVTRTTATQVGSRRVERVRAARHRADRAFFEQARAARRSRERVEILYWTLITAEIVIPLAVVAQRTVRAGARRRRAAAGVPTTLPDPPGGLAPDLVALVDNGGNHIGAASVAATVLDLIVRGRITLDHVTSTTFRIRPVPGTTVPVGSDADRALLDELQRITGGDPDGWADSPVELVRGGPWWRRYRRDIVRRARSDGLVRHRFPPVVFVAGVIALVVTSAPLWSHDPTRATIVVIVAMGLLALSAFGGFELTEAGLTARTRWRAFGRHAAGDLTLPAASVPAVTVRGEHLVAAAALGVAMPAVTASSRTRREVRGERR